MPTGYTADVGEGKITTLREFALRCARGMGACVMMRDDPWDAPIPERFEPRFDYHTERLAEAKALLADTETLSDEECDARAQSEFEEQMASHEKWVSERKIENERYKAMLSAVEAWSTEAEGIKEFMAEQLRISIHDWEPDQPQELTADQWRREMRAKALHDIAYHEKQIAEEFHRTEMRNLWLAALRRSLPSA
jgi:hypothetical protein